MAKPNRRLTRAERKAREERNKDFEFIFINGKQKRVRKEPMIEGMSVEEFIRNNADPIWLHQNERREDIEPEPQERIERDEN
jgi:hypothetical protein